LFISTSLTLKLYLPGERKRGYVINPAHKKWEIIKRQYPPIPLTLEELENLESAKIENKAHDRGRDYLALECRIGQRISDLKKIRKDLIDHENRTWTHKPQKGNRTSSKTITVYFKGYCAPAYMILAKYDFQMPKVSDQKINENIKEACKTAGIDKQIFIERWAGNRRIRIHGKKYEFISSHTGRKTFITIGLQYMPPKLVMDLAGIDSYETLKHYEGESQGDIIEQYLKSIEDNKPIMKVSNGKG
jgi:integrase